LLPIPSCIEILHLATPPLIRRRVRDLRSYGIERLDEDILLPVTYL
jgi:hypothetical protein